MAKSKSVMQLASPGRELLGFIGNHRFATILADPPWQFQTGQERWRPNTDAFRATEL